MLDYKCIMKSLQTGGIVRKNRKILQKGNVIMRKKRFALAVLLILCLLPLSASKTHALTTTLRVGFIENQAPYYFVDNNGKAVGMYIDMLEHLAVASRYELVYFPMATGTDCEQALEKGDIDIMLDITQKHRGSVWMTNPLSEETICSVINRQTFVEGGDNIGAFQVGTLTPAVSIRLDTEYNHLVSDPKKAVEMLLSGTANIMVGIKESVQFYMKDIENSDIYGIENNYIGIVSMGILVRENDYALLWNLNDQIAELRSSEAYNDIRLRWVNQDAETVNVKGLRRLVFTLFAVVIVVSAYAGTNAYVRKKLKQQVDEKTYALQLANREIMQRMEQLESESDIRNRIISYSHLGMMLYDRDYQIKMINASALAMAGCTHSPGDARSVGVLNKIIDIYEADAWDESREITHEQVQIYEEAGKKYRFSFQRLLCAPDTWDVLLVVEDATGEEAQRHSSFEKEKSKLLNQVVAGIAHEIKNPLMSIKGFAELMREESCDPQFIEDFSHYVPAEVERINRLVEGLIGYARPAKGPQTLINLTELVQEAVFFAKNTNRAKNLLIESDLEKGHCIVANRDQIKQVLINIVLNSMESMREKLAMHPERQLKLRITLTGAPGESKITVRDEGMGMKPQAIERCMDPFFTTKRTGTGLGLTVSKQYVQDNHGTLQIDSIPDEYTEITIVFRRGNDETTYFNS